MCSPQNESKEDGFKHPDSSEVFHGNPAQTHSPPGSMNNEDYPTQNSDWNTAANEYVNGGVKPENPVKSNGENVVPDSSPPFNQWAPKSPNVPNHRKKNILKNTKETFPPPVVNWSNGMAYFRYPNSMEMANYETPSDNFAPSPYYSYISPQNKPSNYVVNGITTISKDLNGNPIPPNVKRNNDIDQRHPNNMGMANYQTPPTNFAPSYYYYLPQNNSIYLPHKSSNISKTIPPNEKRNNDIDQTHPNNMGMANYQTPPTYFPPPYYYCSPQNNLLYLQHQGNPTYPRYNNPNSTLYQPYPQPGYPQTHLPSAGQKPLLVKSCKPYVKPSPSECNKYTKPEILPVSQDKGVEHVKIKWRNDREKMNVKEEPIIVETVISTESIPNVKPSPSECNKYTKPEILPVSQDEGVEHVKIKWRNDREKINVKEEPIIVETVISTESIPNVKPSPSECNKYTKPEILPVSQDKGVELVKIKWRNDREKMNVKEEPIIVETVISTESIKKEHISTKQNKKTVTTGPTVINQENQKPAKEKDVPIVIEAKEEITTLKNELVPSQISIPLSKLDVQETEPIKESFKTWAGLFSGWSYKSKDEVLKQHDNTAPDTNNPVSDNLNQSSASEANHNKKQTFPANSTPPSNNSSDDDNTLHLQRLGKFLSSFTLDHKTAHLQPRGLINRNTYCYINATLQALLTCPPFFNLMKSVQSKLENEDPREIQKSKIPILESMIQFISEFQLLSLENGRATQQQLQDMSVATEELPIDGPAFEPNYLYKVLSSFEEGRQEDAEEFMSYLLNYIDDEMIELIKMSRSNQINGETQAVVDTIDNKELTKVNGKHNKDARQIVVEKTPLSKIFRGRLRTRTVKSYEKKPTDTIEPFFTLKLDIEKANSVTEALDILATKNTLEGLTCPMTNRESDAYQQITIDLLPYVLLLHLKCFEYKEQKLTKIMKNIEFSVDLEIESKLISQKSRKKIKTRKYKLFAVVYHNGVEATEGHYIADVFYEGFNRWLRFDDANLSFVPDEEVCQPQPPCMPYLLFYRRIDTIDAI